MSRVTCRHLDQVTGGVSPARPLSRRLVIIWPRPAEGSLQPVQAGWSSGDKFVVIIVFFIHIFITIISVARNHKGAWTRVLFYSLHLCKCPTQITKSAQHTSNALLVVVCEMLSVPRPECDWEQRVWELFVLGLRGVSRSLDLHRTQRRRHHPSPLACLLLRTAVRGLLANCFYIKHFILDEINSIIVGGFVKKVNLKCVLKRLCNNCWASVEDQSSLGEILMESEGLWVLETYTWHLSN